MSNNEEKDDNVVVVKEYGLGKGLASVGVCFLGVACMYLTNGNTGVGWAVLGLFLIWGC